MSKLKNYTEEFQFEEGPLIVRTMGCPMAIADGEHMFAKMRGKITEPTFIFLICNVVEWHEIIARKKAMEIQQEYPNHKLFITGCVNEVIGEKFKKYGTLVYRDNMWNPDSYLQ